MTCARCGVPTIGRLDNTLSVFGKRALLLLECIICMALDKGGSQRNHTIQPTTLMSASMHFT